MRQSWLAAVVLVASIAVFLNGSPAQAARYAAIVVDAGTGKVLHADDADARRYPASLTKMMTLYLVFDALDSGKLKLNQKLRVSRHAAGQPPSGLGLDPGDRITVEDAILATAIKSANDAAVVLAEAVSGTEWKFAHAMNAKAEALGMDQTNFRNASGLPNRRQVTTARDMATLAIALLRKHADRYHYFGEPEFSWNDRTYTNHNHLLDDYDGMDGFKTGFIRASGFNLVASAKRDGRRLIGVVFGGVTGAARDKRMAELLDDGFESASGLMLASGSLRLPSLISKAEAAPIVAPPARGDWAIQVGAFSRQNSAQKQLKLSGNAAPKHLHGKESAVLRIKSRGKTMYRARFTDLTEAEARSACQYLKKRRMVCAIISGDS